MLNKEYREILGRLPIENPTPEDMAQLCPHLTRKQAIAAFTNGKDYVACPPLRIRGAFQIVSFSEGYVEKIKVWGVVNGKETQTVTGTKEHPPRLDYSFAGRTLQSYADGKLHGDVIINYKYMAEAMKFAEDNWGDMLILDTWADVCEFIIDDPSDLTKGGNPKTKVVLRACFNRGWNDITNDNTRPQSILIDEVISEMTLDTMVWHELKGGRGGFTEFNCAYCGYGLGLSGCNGCNHKFKEDAFRCGWSTPLSKKMIEFLQANGHVFKMDPAIAWQKEIEEYEKTRREFAEYQRRVEAMRG